MSARRQGAIEAVRGAIRECSCPRGDLCSMCQDLEMVIDLLEGDDVIPPDGWTVAGEQTMRPGVVLRARPGDRIVTLRDLR